MPRSPLFVGHRPSLHVEQLGPLYVCQRQRVRNCVSNQGLVLDMQNPLELAPCVCTSWLTKDMSDVLAW